ncbi:MAG: Rha family transcriptional regulator, partial [Ruminococcus sp.]|nr:Rha family transcriptional regulator [Ruminococcus sp.]
MNEIVITNINGELTTSSLGVAERFGKQHKDVLEKISNIKAEMNSAEFSAQYFIESIYIDNSGKSNKCYELTRDGFSLLVMGFTGKKALEWKLKYIEAFNLMEQKLREQSKKKMSANELIFEMAKSNLETEKRINALESKQKAIEERTEKVLDVFTMPTDTAWHKAIMNQFKKICYDNNLNYHTTLGNLYRQLENEVSCSLSSR